MQEVHVIQSAVSHQLKHLEALWGVQLFERGKALRLTAAGATLAPIVREFFISLEATLGDLCEQEGRVRLRVSTTYSFAIKWLLPRLPRLSRQHPELLVSLDTTDKIIHFAHGQADVAIRLGKGNYPGLHSEFLFGEQVFPVASPELLRRMGTPQSPADLLHFPLLTRDGADLVRLFDVLPASPLAYYFVCPKGIESQPHIASFRQWLVSEALKVQRPEE